MIKDRRSNAASQTSIARFVPVRGPHEGGAFYDGPDPQATDLDEHPHLGLPSQGYGLPTTGRSLGSLGPFAGEEVAHRRRIAEIELGMGARHDHEVLETRGPETTYQRRAQKTPDAPRL